MENMRNPLFRAALDTRAGNQAPFTPPPRCFWKPVPEGIGGRKETRGELPVIVSNGVEEIQGCRFFWAIEALS